VNEDFEDILALLIEHHAEFLIVGAHALAVHGAARATGDIDILVRPTRANAERVCDALRAFGAPLRLHGVGPAELSTEGNVYQLGLPPRRIDILTKIDGVSFDEAWQGHVTVDNGERRLPFLGRDELVKNKAAAGRPKDLADIALLAEGNQQEPGTE
jgi:hypothetical protein